MMNGNVLFLYSCRKVYSNIVRPMCYISEPTIVDITIVPASNQTIQMH